LLSVTDGVVVRALRFARLRRQGCRRRRIHLARELAHSRGARSLFAAPTGLAESSGQLRGRGVLRARASASSPLGITNSVAPAGS
jgi:hypothetical protein